LEQLLRVSQYTGVTRRAGANGENDSRAVSLVGYKRVAPGELAVNIMLAWNGSLGASRFEGIVSPAYCVYAFSADALPWYFHHLLRSPSYRARIKTLSSGVVESRLRLYTDDLYGLEGLVPPAEEQAAIVKYLGHAHARIDWAIAAKSKLIALLEEQKQAVINHAVTRGLDPTVPMKNSGIPWLGEIPAHWTVRKLVAVFALQGSGTTPPRDEHYDGGIPWIMSGDLNDGEVSRTKRTVTSGAVASLSSLKVYQPGSLVIAMYGATIGKTGINTMEAATNQACCVFSEPRLGADVAYMQLAVLIGKPALVEQGFGGGQPNVNAETVRQFKVPTPPAHEQRAIVEFCESESDRSAAIIGRAAREIELLREFRTRLTSDVVTGQVDVREIAATLPEFIEPSEAAADSVDDEPLDEESADELDEVLEEADA
jgi:type I restriction enzyme S subunit